MFKKLTGCEELVMRVVWDAGEELDLAETTRRVNDKFHKGWAPQTVSTFLARIVGKGYLKSYRKGRVFFYQILVTFKEYRNYITREFMDSWYHGSSGGADARIALEAYNTLMEYCKAQGNCENCLMAGEDTGTVDCIMKLQDYPKRWQQLDLD